MRPTLDRREAERLVNTYADSILRLSYACLGDTQGAQALCQTILRQRLEQGACLDDPAKEPPRNAFGSCGPRSGPARSTPRWTQRPRAAWPGSSAKGKAYPTGKPLV